LDVLQHASGVILRSTDTSPFASLKPNPVQEFDLVPVRQDLFTFRESGRQTWTPVTFYRLPDGTPYLHLGARAYPKVS
jgi:hypothetical protein